MNGEQVISASEQVADSYSHLDKQKTFSLEATTSIRVEADAKESQRRIDSEEQRQERLAQLSNEAIASGKANAEIEMHWPDIINHNKPQELKNAIETQGASCAKIINSKDLLIKEFEAKAKKNDDAHVKALNAQAEEIKTLLERMRHQYEMLYHEYNQELRRIEDACLKERDQVLTGNKKELDELLEKIRSMEIQRLDKKQELEENNRGNIDTMRLQDASEYQSLKVKLETDIQTLEQQLEEMRATYQLNTEKLEYNYRVLTERDLENTQTVTRQKRKLARLKDLLSKYKARFAQEDKKYKQKNAALTEEYRRVTKQFNELQRKSQSFQHNDEVKYNQARDMHEKEVKSSSEKLISAAEIISTQILGLDYERPVLGTVKSTAPPSASQVDTISMIDTSNNTIRLGAGPGEGILLVNDSRGRVANARVKVMLQLLADEVTFLLDNKTKSQIATAKRRGDEEQSHLIACDGIIRALQVSNENQLQELTSLFFYELESYDDDEDALGEQQGDIGLKVTADQVTRVITQYRQQQGIPTTVVSEDGEDHKITKQVSEQRTENAFWKRASNLLSEEDRLVWEELSKGEDKLAALLQRRHNSMKELEEMKAVNEQLRLALAQNLNSRDNDYLHVPPTQVIHLDASTTESMHQL